MGVWSISKLKSAKESIEDAKESLKYLGMDSAIGQLGDVLDYIDEELEAEEEE